MRPAVTWMDSVGLAPAFGVCLPNIDRSFFNGSVYPLICAVELQEELNRTIGWIDLGRPRKSSEVVESTSWVAIENTVSAAQHIASVSASCFP
jgi:hypothetical protein